MRHLVVPAAFLALFSTACTNGDGDDTPAGASGSVAGSLLFVPATAPLTEVEPNDSVDEPQPAGEIARGGSLAIRGAIGAGEGFDAYALVARERVEIEAELRFAAAPGRRVELLVYDPLAMGVVHRADASGKVAFTAGGPFDLVVRGAQGAGEYELVVRAVAAPETISRSGWVGAVSTGDALRLGSDSAGRYEFTTTEALDLLITARGPAAQLVRAYTVARDGDGPASTMGGGASVRAYLEPLERIVIETPAGSGATIEALPRSAKEPLRTPPDRLLASERERADFGLAAGELLYGRAPSNAKAGELLVKARGNANLADDLARRGLARTGMVGADVQQVAAELDLIADADLRARVTVALARSLAASPRVEYAELNRIRRPLGGTTPFEPNDGFYGLQWHYPQIRLPEAWGEVRNFVTGPGDDVIVAVIDTGRRSHVDLNANTLTGIEFDFITDPSIADDGDGPDAIALDEGDSEGVGPSSFHGTHVAGTIAAVSDNGTGVAGVGSVPVGTPTAVSRVKVVHLRVLGKGGGTDADIARAILYAGALQTGLSPEPTPLFQPVDVVNLSLGGPGSNSTVQSAVTSARNRGVAIFAAAGNSNSGSPFYPAAYANVISVAAVDQNSVRAPYSNFHASVDLCAPGGDTSVNTNPGTGPGQDEYVDGVLSTLVDETSGSPIYVFYQGTSMACPHAAGVAALMKIVSPTLTPPEIESRLTSTATDLGAAGRDDFHGFGLINALRAVQSAGTGGSGTPVLGVGPSALNFAPEVSQLELSILNLGGGTIDVTAFTDDQTWLSLANAGAGPGIDVGRLTVTVDRDDPALAADGSYAATISITTDAGSIAVPVAVQVATPVFPDIELVVLAVDFSVDPPVTVAETVVNPSLVGFEYVLDELSTVDGLLLPPGDYLIACGSDENPDGFICGEGDVYCGLYPTLNDPALVRVNGTVTGINFVVAPLESGPALTAFQGYPRRPR